MKSSLAPALFGALLLGAAAACSPDDPGSRTVQRPDVVLFVVDTLRADHLGTYGYGRPTSPALDRLSRTGVVCEDVTAQWPWTLPSMVSMFQGQYITAYRDKLDETVPTLAERFHDAGYRTVALVANNIVDEGQGFARGFDHFDCIGWADEAEKVPGKRDIRDIEALLDAQLPEALALDASGERPPLFLWIHAYDPHDAYTAHPEFKAELPQAGAEDAELRSWWLATLAELGARGPANDPQWEAALDELRNQRGRYDQEVRYLDAGIDRILTSLEAAGIGDDAVYALVSDHGEGLWEHIANEPPANLPGYLPRRIFYMIHGANGYETVSATPFLLWGGGVPQGLRVTRAVENVDLYPTLLQLADLAPPEGLHGRSLVPLFEAAAQQEMSWREHVFCYGSHTVSVRHAESGWKLILPAGKSLRNGRGLELYQLREDPRERVNRASSEPELVAELVAAYEAWMAAHPTVSNLKGKLAENEAAQRAALAKKLQALGYTESETGLGDEGDDQ